MERKVSLRHMRCFLAVAQTGSFTAAASRMFLTQSSLTATIQQFEETVGVRLFERSTRRVVMTEAALRFREETEKIVNEFDTSIRDLKAFGQAQHSRIRIAAAASVIYRFVVPAIPLLRNAYPNITLSLRDADATRVERMVINGDVDFAIISKHKGYKELEYIPLVEDQYGVVCRSPYPLAAATTPMRWRDLPADDYVQFTVDTAIGTFLATHVAASRLYAGPRDEVSSTTSLYAVLGLGDRYSIAPAFVASAGPFPYLHYRELIDPVVSREICLITRRLRYLTPDAKRILDILLETFGRKDLPRGASAHKRRASPLR